MPNHSTIPDSDTVIYLGHSPKEPLIRRSSELGDGLEPHALITPAVDGVRSCYRCRGEGGVYPGWDGWVGTWRVLYRVLTSRGQIEAYLMNIL